MKHLASRKPKKINRNYSDDKNGGSNTLVIVHIVYDFIILIISGIIIIFIIKNKYFSSYNIEKIR